MRFMYKVALLEDDEWILKGIEKSFRWADYGFAVVGSFVDPLELLEYLEDNFVDVIFTDIEMPGMTGLELIKKVKLDLSFKDILFVIISAYDDYEYMRKAIKLDVLDYCKKPIRRSMTDGILKALAEKLKDLPERTINSVAIRQNRFQEIIEYINKNYSCKLTLKKLSEKFHFNANYICLLFKNNLNMKFSEYLQKVRMEKAKELLATKAYSIKEVHNMVGYSDYSYFNSVFTQYYGVTPANFLNKNELS